MEDNFNDGHCWSFVVIDGLPRETIFCFIGDFFSAVKSISIKSF